jgi:hypothetical protein
MDHRDLQGDNQLIPLHHGGNYLESFVPRSTVGISKLVPLPFPPLVHPINHTPLTRSNHPFLT